MIWKYTLQNQLDTPADDGRHYKGFKSIGKSFKKVGKAFRKVKDPALTISTGGLYNSSTKELGYGVTGVTAARAAEQAAKDQKKAAAEQAEYNASLIAFEKEAAKEQARVTRLQEREVAKQDAALAKQEAALEKKRKLARGVSEERRNRMSSNQLLSGSETGTAASSNSLLG